MSMMDLRKSFRRFLPLLLFFLLLIPAAHAVEAEDVVSKCTIRATENQDIRRYLWTDNYKQRWEAGEKGVLNIKLPDHQTCQGVMISHYGRETAVKILDANGEQIGYGPGKYRVEWIPFTRNSSEFVLMREHPEDILDISRLHVLTAGDLPDWVQRWETLDSPAELMLISTHPDDEILWFGGILPYYAGELHRKVIVVYMVGALNSVRTLELLDGLWSMGVTCYPDIGSFNDVGKHNIGSVYEYWGRNGAEKRIVEMIRKYQPQVVITQDVNGEYGHQAHVATVNAIIDIFEKELAGNPQEYPESAAEFGVWTPLKLYIHLWKANEIRFDWNQPLSAFNGKTALEVAKAAFKKHVSQQNGKYAVRDSGQYDCSRFGLYWSSVGPDVQHNDLFENVPASE